MSCNQGGQSVVTVPDRLRLKASQRPDRREWLAEVPDVCRRLSCEWSLELGAAFEECHISLVVAAKRESAPVVLKLPMPAQVELGTLAASARGSEAEALRLWAGQGAVQLLEHDEVSGAMLMERCVPGSTLDHLTDGAATDQITAELLEQLHQPSPIDGGFVRLAELGGLLARDVATRYERAGSPFDRWLVDAAVELLDELSDWGPADVLLHGDLHHHNVLAASRQPWLAIDPLPMAGDPAYDVVQYLLFRKGDLNDPDSAWDPVIERFCSRLGVDVERVKAWMFARLVSDAVAAYAEEGESVDSLEATQGDLWSARLLHRLRA